MKSSSIVASADGSISAVLSASGLVSLSFNGGPAIPFTGGITGVTRGTLLSPSVCTSDAPGSLQHAINGGFSVAQSFTCSVALPHPQHGTANVTVSISDSFEAAPHSIKIATTVQCLTPLAPLFSVGLRTGVSWPASSSESMRLWLPWSKGCVQNNGDRPGMCFTSGPWREALSPEALPSSSEYYRFGSGSKGAKDSFALPIASLLNVGGTAASTAEALSIALDPSDNITELTLHASPTAVGFERELLRLGGGSRWAPSAPLTFTAHLVGHANCYRPGLAFLTNVFADFFTPPIGDEEAAKFEGLASYSSNLDALDAERARSLGFKTNWDLSGTFMPYDGLFLPYAEQWLNLGPINTGLSQYNATYALIEKVYANYQSAGFHSLSYFDIGNWGTRTNTNYLGPTRYCGERPNGLPAPCPDPDGANSFLRDQLWPALLHHGWSVNNGKFMVHHYDWVGTTDMDTQ